MTRTLGQVDGVLMWKDEEGNVYPALSKCCQDLLASVMFVTARCDRCGKPADLRRLA